MRKLKIKLIISNVLLLVAIMLLVGATIAYFTDSKKISSTLTSGNVKIMLSEAAVKQDTAGNLVEDNNATRVFGGQDFSIHDYGKIYPGQTIYKDPTIQNTGDNDAWIAAKVTLKDGEGELHKIIGYDNYEGIDIEMLLIGGLLDERVHVGTWNGIENVCYNERYAMVQVPSAAEGEFEFYFFFLETFEQGHSEVLFDTLSIPAYWNNQEMKELVNLEIQIQAFGAQTSGFETCYDAMTNAFPTYFDF